MMTRKWTRTKQRSAALMLAALVLMASVASIAAAPPQQAGTTASRGLFGAVVAVEAGFVVLRTASQGEVRVALSADTEYRAAGVDPNGVILPLVGERVAVLVIELQGAFTASTLMVLSDRVRVQVSAVVHITGVITVGDNGAVTVVTEDGRRVVVEFGLSSNVLEPGVVVTVVGRIDAETGVLLAKSAHKVQQTLDRIQNHLADVETQITDSAGQVRRVAQLRQVIDRIGTQQLRLVDRVLEHAPDDAKPALELAVQNLERAKAAVQQAVDRALEITSNQEREKDRIQRPTDRRLPKDVKPTLADIARGLGISEDDLLALLKRGVSVEAAAEERGVTIAQLYERIIAAIRPRLEALVEQGALAPESLELLLSDMRERLAEHIRDLFNDKDVRPDLPFSIEDLAQILGITPEELYAQLKEGLTLQEVGEEHGVSADQWLAGLERLARARAEELRQQGVLLGEKVEEYINGLLARVRAALAQRKTERLAERPDRQPQLSLNVSFDRALVARALGLPLEELVRLLGEGVTVEEIAQRQGVDFTTVVDALLATLHEKVAALVEAGDLDRERAAKLLEEARERIVQALRKIVRTTQVDAPQRDRDAGDAPYPGLPLTMENVAQALGISIEELQKWLAQPGGIRNLLKELDLNPEQVVATLLELAEPTLFRMAEQGDVSREELGKVLARLKQRLLDDLGGRRVVKPTVTSAAREAEPASFLPFDANVVSQLLGLSPEELRKLLASGTTVEQIAARTGVSLGRIVATLMGPVERSADALTDRDSVTARQVQEKLEAAQESILRTLQGFRLTNVGEDRERPAQTDEQRSVLDEAKERLQEGRDAAQERLEQALKERERLEQELKEREVDEDGQRDDERTNETRHSTDPATATRSVVR